MLSSPHLTLSNNHLISHNPQLRPARQVSVVIVDISRKIIPSVCLYEDYVVSTNDGQVFRLTEDSSKRINNIRLVG